MHAREHPRRWRILLAFALVYFFWGSTYLAIGVAVESIPPEMMAGSRFLIAGALMLAWCAWSGRGIRLTLADAVRLGTIGILMLSVSNVILAWAEQTVPTGLSALLVAVTPIWFLVLETWIFRGDRMTRRGLLGVPLGLAGIVVLLWPDLTATAALDHRELFAASILPFACFAWATGSALSKRWQSRIDPFSASGWEMLIAGAVNVVMGFVLGEQHRAVWNLRGIGAIAYLVVFGSWVGFSAYIWLLQHVPIPKVATYAYVNPVVAVFLGWLVLHERVDRYIVMGTVVIVAAVALTTSAKVKRGAEPAAEELPAVEGTG
ncbi:MAG TPA: EamA family transporter [Terriglobales bacterium]|nr:EamA family transporter [Terriglobales bacterium]